MKKIIGIVFISLMFANIGFAEIREIEVVRIDGRGTYTSDFLVTTVCVNGQKFVIAKSKNSTSISMVQFYTVGNKGYEKPVMC